MRILSVYVSILAPQRNNQIRAGGLDSLRMMKVHHDDATRNRCRDPHP